MSLTLPTREELMEAMRRQVAESAQAAPRDAGTLTRIAEAAMPASFTAPQLHPRSFDLLPSVIRGNGLAKSPDTYNRRVELAPVETITAAPQMPSQAVPHAPEVDLSWEYNRGWLRTLVPASHHDYAYFDAPKNDLRVDLVRERLKCICNIILLKWRISVGIAADIMSIQAGQSNGAPNETMAYLRSAHEAEGRFEVVLGKLERAQRVSGLKAI